MKPLLRALAFLLLLAAPALAAPTPAQLSQADRADLTRVENYLNGIRTMRSSFVQATPDGSLMRGVFYLSRPGKMRLEYEPPVKDYVVADGLFVFYWDDRMQQSSSAPIGTTLADVILRKDLKLSGDVTVTGLTHSPGVLEVSLVQTDDPGKGELTLVFEDNPLRLRKWRVVDAQGLTTEVALMNPQIGVDLDHKLFFFADPNLGKKRD